MNEIRFSPFFMDLSRMRSRQVWPYEKAVCVGAQCNPFRTNAQKVWLHPGPGLVLEARLDRKRRLMPS